MKKQISKKEALILTAIATIILLGAGVSMFAQGGRTSVKTQTGVGQPFGARDPETCQATGGSRMPSAAEAIASFKCGFEGETSNYLTLVEDVSVQIGKAHPYDPNFGSFEPNIDTKYLIYPIRGSFQRYKCSPVSDYSQNKGRNCWIDDHPHAEGECYKTEWGDWHCFMLDKDKKTVAENVPPPGAKTTDNAAQNTAKKNNPAPKNANKTADNTPAKNADETTAQTEYPTPDFSEMEKWFDIVKYEYGDLAGGDANIYVWVKPKVPYDVRPDAFNVTFTDKDGVQTRYPLAVGNITEGDTGKAWGRAPTEREMEKIVSVKVTRVKR